MPYAQCPKCKSLHYFSVDDEAAWYKQHFPSVKPGHVVPALCAACAKAKVEARHEEMKRRQR